MTERRVYLCRACCNDLTPCVAVTDGAGELQCLHTCGDEHWIECDPVIAQGILSALAAEQAAMVREGC